MKSVEQVQLKEIPERPHRLGSNQDRGIRRRYVPDWGGGHASQPTAHAVGQARTAGSRIAELGTVSHGTTIKKVGEKVTNAEISRPEFRRRLVTQCWILVVIAGIVAWLIAA
jgi:hypothetical protein